MIVRDEEANLASCLDSIKSVVDEIILVDTGSTDRTIEIAERYGAKVIKSEWKDDFSYSRNISLSAATSRWILWMDADDIMESTSLDEITKLKNGDEKAGYYFNIKNKTIGSFSDSFLQIRMFPNNPLIKFERKIHEQVSISLYKNGYELKPIQNISIVHTGYVDQSKKVSKALRNRKIIETEIDKYKNEPAFLSSYADTFGMVNDWERAIEIWKQVIEIKGANESHPDIYIMMYVNIGMAYYTLKKYSEALHYCISGLIIDAKNIQLNYLSGMICFTSGSLKSSKEYFEAAINAPEIINTTPVGHKSLRLVSMVHLGHIARKNKDFASAHAWYDKVNSVYPFFHDLPGHIGEAFMEEGKYIEAVNAFSDSAKRFPGCDPKVFLRMADISNKFNRHKDAEMFLNKYYELFVKASR